jgi:serine/threonine protein kinase
LVRGIVRASDPNPRVYTLSELEKVEKIGEGTFGQVYRAQVKLPGGGVKQLALKKLNMVMNTQNDLGFPLTALREIKYLSILDHDNIVRIRQVLHSKRKCQNS